MSTADKIAEQPLEKEAPAPHDEGPTPQDEEVSEKVYGSTGSCDGSMGSTAPLSRSLLQLNRFPCIVLCHHHEHARRQRLEVRRDAHQKHEKAHQKYNLPPNVAIPWVLVEGGGTTQVYVGAVSKLSKTGPRPGAGEELYHIPPGQGALDGGSQVKAVTWPVIAIQKETAFTSEERATSALQEWRLAEEKGEGGVHVEQKDVPKESGAHMEEQTEENVVVEDAPMVEHSACVKQQTADEVVEEGVEEAPVVKVAEEMKAESMEEVKPDEEPREDVGMQWERADNTTSGENTISGDNATSGEKTTSGYGDAKPMPSGDVASSSSAADLLPTRGTPH